MMSISLIVLEPKNREYSLVNIPLATEDMFQKIWLLGAEQLDAKWLPLFQSGIDLTSDDFEGVSDELMALHEWIKTAAIDPDEKSIVLTRIEVVLKELTILKNQTGGKVEIFIG